MSEQQPKNGHQVDTKEIPSFLFSEVQVYFAMLEGNTNIYQGRLFHESGILEVYSLKPLDQKAAQSICHELKSEKVWANHLAESGDDPENIISLQADKYIQAKRRGLVPESNSLGIHIEQRALRMIYESAIQIKQNQQYESFAKIKMSSIE